MSIFGELQRRNVIRVAAAYAVASWVLMQIVDVIMLATMNRDREIVGLSPFDANYQVVQ